MVSNIRTKLHIIEPNQTHSEPNASFSKKTNRNLTEIKRSVPHIPRTEASSGYNKRQNEMEKLCDNIIVNQWLTKENRKTFVYGER